MSAREVFIFWTLVEKEARGGAVEKRRREHGTNLAILETASELKNLLALNFFSRWLFKHQARISGHDVAHNFFSIKKIRASI